MPPRHPDPNFPYQFFSQHPFFAGPDQEQSENEEKQEGEPSEPRRPHHGRPHHSGPGPNFYFDPEQCARGFAAAFGGHPGRQHPFHGRGGWRGGRRGGCRRGGYRPFFNPAFFGQDLENDENSDFSPDIDVFDTTEAFYVHVSLPGANKEEVGVSWDAEKSELLIAGIISRPGDEEFLKTLTVSERSIGPFERKVELTSNGKPAQIDVEAITAKMDNGVLTVEVPKLDNGFVDVKKIEIE